MRKTPAHILIIILILSLVASVSACGTETPTPGPTPQPSTEPLPPPTQPPPDNNGPNNPPSPTPPGNDEPRPVELGFPPLFILHEHYYPDGSDLDRSLFFRENGYVEVRSSESSDLFTFDVIGYNILIFDGENPIDGFDVIDVATIRSMLSNEVFALKGTFNEGLVMRQHYYLNGDKDSESLLFINPEGDVDLRPLSGVVTRGSYTLSGSSLVLEYQGASQDFIIINSYLIETENGEKFIRVQ